MPTRMPTSTPTPIPTDYGGGNISSGEIIESSIEIHTCLDLTSQVVLLLKNVRSPN